MQGPKGQGRIGCEEADVAMQGQTPLGFRYRWGGTVAMDQRARMTFFSCVHAEHLPAIRRSCFLTSMVEVALRT